MTIKDLLGSKYKAGMTLEEIEKALEDMTLPEDNSAEVERLRNALTKSNGEAAEWKRKHNALLSEDEVKKQKEEEERNELQSKYDKLLRDTSISQNKAKLLAMGYEEKLADATAEAMVDGKMDVVFANQKKHLDAFEKRVRADALKDTPKPTGDGDGKVMTLEKLRKMSTQERYEYSKNHPTEYKELYTGTGGTE